MVTASTLVLKNASVFDDLSDAERGELLAMAQRIEVASGAMLIEEGHEGHDFFLLMNGRAAIHVAMPDGQESEAIAMVKAGETIGESMLLGRRRRIATAIAKDRIEGLRWDVGALLKHFEAAPRTGYVVMTNLARTIHDRLTSTNMMLRNALNRSVDIY